MTAGQGARGPCRASGRARGSLRLAVVAAGLVVGVFAGAAPARAQILTDSQPAFSLERFTPPPGPTPFFTAEDGDVLARGAFSAGLASALMARPLVLVDLTTGEQALVPVAWRLGLEAAGALGLGTRWQVGAALPVAVQSGDRLADIGLDDAPLDAVALGDLRVSGKARLVGKPGEPGRAVAVAVILSLPTGDEGQFAGEAGAVIEWRLIGSWRNRWLHVAANLGPRIRTTEVVLLSPARPHGNELVGSAALAASIPVFPHDRLTGSLEYAFAIGDAGPSGSRGPSPGELRGGVRFQLSQGVSIGVAAGAGTTPDDPGAPAWRAVVSARFDSAPTTDLDRDGVPDGRDACRKHAEDRDGYADWDGCPDDDNDRDGYPDDRDDCPDQPEDYDGHRDVDGCPD